MQRPVYSTWWSSTWGQEGFADVSVSPLKIPKSHREGTDRAISGDLWQPNLLENDHILFIFSYFFAHVLWLLCKVSLRIHMDTPNQSYSPPFEVGPRPWSFCCANFLAGPQQWPLRHPCHCNPILSVALYQIKMIKVTAFQLHQVHHVHPIVGKKMVETHGVKTKYKIATRSMIHIDPWKLGCSYFKSSPIPIHTCSLRPRTRRLSPTLMSFLASELMDSRSVLNVVAGCSWARHTSDEFPCSRESFVHHEVSWRFQGVKSQQFITICFNIPVPLFPSQTFHRRYISGNEEHPEKNKNKNTHLMKRYKENIRKPRKASGWHVDNFPPKKPRDTFHSDRDGRGVRRYTPRGRGPTPRPKKAQPAQLGDLLATRKGFHVISCDFTY